MKTFFYWLLLVSSAAAAADTSKTLQTENPTEKSGRDSPTAPNRNADSAKSSRSIEEQIDAAGANTFNQVVEQAQKNNKLLPPTDPIFISLNSKLNRLLSLSLAQHLPRSSNWKWELAVIDSPSAEATSVAGGKIFIHAGLLQKTSPTDDETVSLLATLIAQLLIDPAKDALRPRVNPIPALLALQAGSTNPNLEAVFSGEIAYRKGRILEADRLARRLLDQIGISADSQVAILEKSYASRKSSVNPSLDMFWPSLNERIANIRSTGK